MPTFGGFHVVVTLIWVGWYSPLLVVDLPLTRGHVRLPGWPHVATLYPFPRYLLRTRCILHLPVDWYYPIVIWCVTLDVT